MNSSTLIGIFIGFRKPAKVFKNCVKIVFYLTRFSAFKDKYCYDINENRKTLKIIITCITFQNKTNVDELRFDSGKSVCVTFNSMTNSRILYFYPGIK